MKLKLIIDINENEYLGIKSFPISTTSYPWTLHLYEAVREGIPLDDIKAEIEEEKYVGAQLSQFHKDCNYGLDLALEIINKHIGKE